MVDTPRKRLGLAVTAGLLAILLIATAAVVYAAQQLPFGGQRVVLHAISLALLGCIIWVTVRAIRLATLHYQIADDRLSVHMGLVRWTVPLAQLERITQPEPAPEHIWSWPGWTYGIVAAGNRTRCVASTMPRRLSLALEGTDWSLIISPRNPTAFVQQLDLSAARSHQQAEGFATEPLGVAAWPVWQDLTVLYPLAISVLGTFFLYAGAALVHPSLPRQITQVGSEAASRVLVPQDAAQALPTVAALGTLANGALCILFHRHSRVLAHLWIYGALAQQAILWVGLWRLLRG